MKAGIKIDLEKKTLFKIENTVSDETSLIYAFMTGILPLGKYNFEICGVPYEVNVVDDYPKVEIIRI